MKVLVTGATGFLGGETVEQLLASGHDVVATGRNQLVGQALSKAGADFIAGDLLDDETMQALAAKAPEAIIHCAALSSNWGRKRAFHTANVSGTEAMLALAERCLVRRFVHISTPSVYFRFADQERLSEDVALPKPVNAYAASKAMSEHRVLKSSIPGRIILRPRGLYGIGDTSLLPRLERVAAKRAVPVLRGGKARTDLTHVSDVARAAIAALTSGKDGQVYNISGGQALPLLDVVREVCERKGIEPRFRELPVAPVLMAARCLEAMCGVWPGQPEPAFTAYSIGVLAYSQTLDISTACRDLDWEPRIDFQKGLALTFPEAL